MPKNEFKKIVSMDNAILSSKNLLVNAWQAIGSDMVSAVKKLPKEGKAKDFQASIIFKHFVVQIALKPSDILKDDIEAVNDYSLTTHKYYLYSDDDMIAKERADGSKLLVKVGDDSVVDGFFSTMLIHKIERESGVLVDDKAAGLLECSLNDLPKGYDLEALHPVTIGNNTILVPKPKHEAPRQNNIEGGKQDVSFKDIKSKVIL